MSAPEHTQIIRSRISIAIALIACISHVGKVDAGCIDYADSIHWVGSVDLDDNPWGLAVSGDYAYIADGAAGLRVVDIADPEQPIIIGSVQTLGTAHCVAVSSTYAYVGCEYQGFEVTDISDPGNPQLAGFLNLPCYCIVISDHYAYVVGGTRLSVIDISNPRDPLLTGFVDVPGDAQGVAISGHYAYVAAYEDGLQVIDISDPIHPQITGSVDTWGRAWRVAILDDHAYVAIGVPIGDGGLEVIDVSNPQSPRIVSSVVTPGSAMSVVISGTYAYVAASGIQVYDITDPLDPIHVGGAVSASPPRRRRRIHTCLHY